jgi:hypothetical protein
MKIGNPSFMFPAIAALALASPVVASAKGCIFTPAELQTATGRSFNAGQESKAVDGSSVCSYTEVAAPKKRLVVNVIESKGKVRFDSSKRLLTMSKKPIDLAGVGDAAYFNGPSAGVLSGDKMIALSGVERAQVPDVPPERVVALLELAIARLPK